jgi:hypothetical protein
MADARVFERMVADLKSRGMTNAAVVQARDRWVNAQRDAPAWPCPLCATSGRSGSLTPMGAREGIESLKCRGCNETIQLAPAGSPPST